MTTYGTILSPLTAAMGLHFEPFPFWATNSQSAPTSQTAYGVPLWGLAGAVVTGIQMRNGVAASGTSPSLARFGLADSTGKLLVLSGDMGAAANWPAGRCRFAFTGLYTLPYTGVYIPCFVVNGTWSVTQPTPVQAGTPTGAAANADGTYPPPNFGWVAQTDLPAIGASLTMTSGTTRSYWLPLY